MSKEFRDLCSADRARWLAELAEAIDEAQRLAGEGRSREARELYAQPEVARAEVEALRRGGWRRHDVDSPPLWLQSLLRAEPAHDLLD